MQQAEIARSGNAANVDVSVRISEILYGTGTE
jgi:hypothetical protein